MHELDGFKVLGQVSVRMKIVGGVLGAAAIGREDLAAAMRCPPPYVTRTAEQLIRKGWVEKDEATGRFRITTRFSRLTFRVLADFDRAKQALEAAQRNYTLSN